MDRFLYKNFYNQKLMEYLGFSHMQLVRGAWGLTLVHSPIMYEIHLHV